MGGRAVFSLALITGASMVAQGFGRFTYPVLLDAIDADLLDSYSRAGLLGTISLIAYLLGTGVIAYASTRVEPVTLVRFGMVLSTTGLILLTVAPGFTVMAIALFITGLGGAAVWIPAPGIAASAVGPEKGGLAIGLVGSGIGMGIVVAGPLTNAVRAIVDDSGVWRPVYGIEAIIALLVLGGLVAVVRFRSGATGANVEWDAIRQVPGWRLLLAAFAIFGVAYSLYFYFLGAQLADAGWSSTSAPLIFTLLGVCSVVGGIGFGRVSDLYGRPWTMAAGFVLMASAPLLTLVGSFVPVVAAAVAFGFCVAGVPTVLGAIVSDHLSGRAFGAAFGSLTFVFGVAQILGPTFAGIIAERTGSFTIPFSVASVFALAGVGCALALRRYSSAPETASSAMRSPS